MMDGYWKKHIHLLFATISRTGETLRASIHPLSRAQSRVSFSRRASGLVAPLPPWAEVSGVSKAWPELELRASWVGLRWI